MGRAQQLGITIGTAFGLAYVLVNSGALPSAVATVLRVLAVLTFIGVQVAMRRGPADGGSAPDGAVRQRFGRGFWTVAFFEVVAVIGGIQVLSRVFDLPDAGVAWVSVVVGVHFNALALVWRESSLHVLAGVLTLLGVAGLVLAFAGASAATVVTVGGVLPGFWLLCGGAMAVAASRAPLQQA